MPTVAGAVTMPYRRFLLANAIGGSLWAAGAVLIGYLAGGSVSSAQDLLGRTSPIGLSFVTVTIVLLMGQPRQAGLRPLLEEASDVVSFR